MKVAVYGSGGVGGYFGGLLARAGKDVAFIARGDHLKAMREQGLQVYSPHGDFILTNLLATDEPQQVGPVDYLIVAVKHFQLEDAAKSMGALLEEDSLILPLLNGVDAHEILVSTLKTGFVVGGLCSLSAFIESPGVIRHASQLRRLVAGELDGKPDPRLQRLLAAWQDCGVDAIHSKDIIADIWMKFLFIASFGGVSSLARASIGEILQVLQTRGLLRTAMVEIESLARAQGIMINVNVVDEVMALVDSLEPSITSSMQRDVAGGKTFELEAFSGKITQLGRALSVPTPTHDCIDALLRPALLRTLIPAQ